MNIRRITAVCTGMLVLVVLLQNPVGAIGEETGRFGNGATFDTQDGDVDLTKLRPEYFDKVANDQEFQDRLGNTYKIIKTKHRRGLYIKRKVGSSEKWLLHGTIYSLHQGKVSSQTMYILDLKHGEFKAFNKQSILTYHCYYKKDVKHGPSTRYYYSGAVHVEVDWKDGDRDGKQISYYHERPKKKGAIQFITPFANGKRHGTVLQYNRRGKLIRQSTWENGKKIGN